MKEPITMPRIVNAADVQWGDHPRFAGIQMKSLLTRVDNELANVNMIQVPPGNAVGWHIHGTQVETIYLLSGQAVLIVGGTELSISAGCIAAIRPEPNIHCAMLDLNPLS